MVKVYLYDEERECLVREWWNDPAHDQTARRVPKSFTADSPEKAFSMAESFVEARAWYRQKSIVFLLKP